MTAPPESWRYLALGEKDFRALGVMLDPASVDDEIFGFHAQQAVEKALKAWMEGLGQEWPRTHDLSLLFLLLEEAGQDTTVFRSLEEISAFGVQFRYEAMEETGRMDRQEIQARVRALLEHVRSFLESLP